MSLLHCRLLLCFIWLICCEGLQVHHVPVHAEFFMKSRWLRSLLLRLVPNIKMAYLAAIGSPHGMVVEVDPSGKVVTVLEDRSGKKVRAVSEVEEHDKKLWLGSVLFPYISVLDWE